MPVLQPRFRNFARVMSVLTSLGIALIVVLGTLAFVIPSWTRNVLLARLGETGALLPVTPASRMTAAAIAAVPLGVMVWGLWHVRAMFVDFAAGRVFTAAAARHLQLFGAAVLLLAVLGPVTAAAFSVGLTLGEPQRMFAIAFSLNDYFALIVGFVLFAAASVMHEAAQIAEENAGFI